MASVVDADLRSFAERGPDVAVAHRDRGQRGDGIDLANGAAGGEDGAAHLRNAIEQRVVQSRFDGDRFLFRADDFLFQHFQIGSDEALGVDQRLLADVVVRHLRQIRLRDFDVVAEDGVEADFQRADARPLPLASFDLDEDRLRVAGDVAELVELGVDARL